jgi:hypothetical protein
LHLLTFDQPFPAQDAIHRRLGYGKAFIIGDPGRQLPAAEFRGLPGYRQYAVFLIGRDPVPRPFSVYRVSHVYTTGRGGFRFEFDLDAVIAGKPGPDDDRADDDCDSKENNGPETEASGLVCHIYCYFALCAA